MFCPKCREEYRDGYYVCADCGIPLVNKFVTKTYKKQRYHTKVHNTV